MPMDDRHSKDIMVSYHTHKNNLLRRWVLKLKSCTRAATSWYFRREKVVFTCFCTILWLKRLWIAVP